MDIISSPGRKYAVLDPDDTLEISGKSFSLDEAVSAYAPVLYLHEDINNMRPIRVFYEAVDGGASVLFNYYVHWKDEIHPNLLFHVFYRQFRSVVYGSPDDIEYVQVGVSKGTGIATRFAFERDPSGKADAFAPAHDVVICERNTDDETFSVRINGKKKKSRNLDIRGNRLSALVATWNHIYDFYIGKGVLLDDPPLEFMTEDLYVKYYMHRRSRPPLP